MGSTDKISVMVQKTTFAGDNLSEFSRKIQKKKKKKKKMAPEEKK